MPKKQIEQWSTALFGKGFTWSGKKLMDLSDREVAILAAGILDIALAELLSKRLVDHPKEIESFLGLNRDGRAPVATFGARIQLALLTGLISPADAVMFRTIKEIRNQFAHTIAIKLTDKQIAVSVAKLYGWLELTANASRKLESVAYVAEMIDKLKDFKTNPKSAKGVVGLTVLIYELMFKGKVDAIVRLPVNIVGFN